MDEWVLLIVCSWRITFGSYAHPRGCHPPPTTTPAPNEIIALVLVVMMVVVAEEEEENQHRPT